MKFLNQEPWYKRVWLRVKKFFTRAENKTKQKVKDKALDALNKIEEKIK